MGRYIDVFCNCGRRISVFGEQSKCGCKREFKYGEDSGGKYIYQTNFQEDVKPLWTYYCFFNIL
jgi:hypothetical protein